MFTLIPDQFATDSILRRLRACGWIIKSPLIIDGITLFPAIKRA